MGARSLRTTSLDSEMREKINKESMEIYTNISTVISHNTSYKIKKNTNLHSMRMKKKQSGI